MTTAVGTPGTKPGTIGGGGLKLRGHVSEFLGGL